MRWALGQGIRNGQPWKSMWRAGECVWHSCQKMQGDAKDTRTSVHTSTRGDAKNTRTPSPVPQVLLLFFFILKNRKIPRTPGPQVQFHVPTSSFQIQEDPCRYLLLYCAFRLSLQTLLYRLNVAKMMKMKPLTIIVAMLLCIFVSSPQAAQWVSLTSSQL